LTGPNGAGKFTFMNLLTGELGRKRELLSAPESSEF
jgi:ABC-type hemin transport system ATPase subunit